MSVSTQPEPSNQPWDGFNIEDKLPSIDKTNRHSGEIELTVQKRYMLTIPWENVPNILRVIANHLRDYGGSLNLNANAIEKINAREKLQPEGGFAGERKYPSTGLMLQKSKEERANFLEQTANHIENYLHPHPDYVADPIGSKPRTGHREYLPYLDLSEAVLQPTFLERNIDPSSGQEFFLINKWMLGEAIYDFINHSSNMYRPKKGSDLYAFYKSEGQGMVAHLNIQMLPDNFPLPTVFIRGNDD